MRFFDNKGKQRAVVGTLGAGPGEFRQLHSICATRGDTVVVSDDGNFRITVLDKNGHVVFSYSRTNVGRAPRNACFADGTYIAGTVSLKAQQTLSRFRLDGTLVNVLGNYPNNNYATDPWKEVSVSVHGSTFLVADPASDELRLYRWPIFDRAELGVDGALWVSTQPRSLYEAPIWSRLSWEGGLLATVALPARTWPTAAQPFSTYTQFIQGGRGSLLTYTQDGEGAPHYQLRAVRPK